MMEEKIMLIDDAGVERQYELVLSFDIEEKTYVLVSENEESDDVYPFFKTADQGLKPVEDEHELALVEAKYDEIMGPEEHDHHHDDQAEMIAVMDETGVEKKYEIIVSLDIEDKTYMLLSENGESDVYPFYVTEDGEGLMPVEDELEFALIAEAYEGLVGNN